ncbi:zinc-ribbon domain-containing protein [Escherichia coli]|uniref:zinc-ribbon domain-containing protein n=1 Tax=Escherichia coli TaxID=562 RepID=UPI0020771E46|nr:zinc-ribbon domain-containing protein [Escherichia coli]
MRDLILQLSKSSIYSTKPYRSLKKDYFRVLCQREYYGLRCCPECRQHIYSTEMKDIDTITVPETFAK